MRPISLVLIFLAPNIHSDQPSRRDRSATLVRQADAHSVLLLTNSQTVGIQHGIKTCAHIVISPIANADPKMVKGSPNNFSSNMPVLRVPPPCDQDSKRN